MEDKIKKIEEDVELVSAECVDDESEREIVVEATDEAGVSEAAEAVASEAAEDEVSEAEASEVAEDASSDDAEADSAASDKADNKKKKRATDESSPRFLSRLVITLTVICAAVAMLLAAVNAVTRDRIADNAAREKNDAILEIFTAGTSSELYKVLDDGSEVYLVFRDGDAIGYCAFVSSTGFGGSIEMMVGIDSAYDTAGVKIVSMSETPGVGTKTNTADFLSRFTGLHHADPVGQVDAISGATISSTAVKAGVSAAHAIEIDLSAICAERGIQLISPERLEEIIAEDAALKADSSGETVAGEPISGEPIESDPSSGEPVSPDTESPTVEPAVTEDDPFVLNPGSRDYLYNIDVSDGSDRFVIEIPKDDETATFEKKTTPAESAAPPTAPATTPAPKVTEPAKVTTAPAETEPPIDDETIPSWLDTEPEETIPSWLDTEPEETIPSWLG